MGERGRGEKKRLDTSRSSPLLFLHAEKRGEEGGKGTRPHPSKPEGEKREETARANWRRRTPDIAAGEKGRKVGESVHFVFHNCRKKEKKGTSFRSEQPCAWNSRGKKGEEEQESAMPSFSASRREKKNKRADCLVFG